MQVKSGKCEVGMKNGQQRPKTDDEGWKQPVEAGRDEKTEAEVKKKGGRGRKRAVEAKKQAREAENSQ